MIGNRHEIARLLPFFWCFCLGALFSGLLLAARTGTPYWVDRSGKVIVAASLILTFYQFQLESKRNALVDARIKDAEGSLLERGMPIVERESILARLSRDLTHAFESSRRVVFINALAAAAAGELTSAFGGVLFSLLALK